MESTVVWQGRLAADAITVMLDLASNRLIDAEIEQLIELEWERQRAEAASRRMTYFDSAAYRVNSFADSDSDLDLHLAPSPYRIHAAIKVLHCDPRISEAHVDRHLIVDAILHTAGDMIAIQSVSKVVETETYLIGGSCSKSRIEIQTATDLANYLLDRVDSVTGLKLGEREIGEVRGIVHSELGCVHLFSTVRTSQNSEVMRRRFEPGATTKSLTFVPRVEWRSWTASVSGYMQTIGDLVP